MGKVRFLKIQGLASIQDEGRFGVRRYGIPQSGAMEVEAMHQANNLVGNPLSFPVVEFALNGFTLEAVEPTILGFAGASTQVIVNNEVSKTNPISVASGDIVKVAAPADRVYSYMSIQGLMIAKLDFESYSTYPLAKLGGLNGEYLRANDLLTTENALHKQVISRAQKECSTTIRIMKGPEWNMLREHPNIKQFTVSSDSNRMAIKLSGDHLDCQKVEILSSAVIPGTIQLPPGGYPIVLMKDCQTTGGYPRIAKVIDEDLGKLAQKRPGELVKLELI